MVIATKVQMLYGFTYIRFFKKIKFTEADGRKVISRGEEGRMVNYCLIDVRLQFGQMKSSEDSGIANPKCHVSKISAKLIVFTKSVVKHTASKSLS